MMPDSDMPQIKVNAVRASQLLSALESVQSRISTATSSASRQSAPRLVLVSKLKPASDILALHSHSPTTLLHFGENYSQELQQKAELLPRTIRWHMIGALQTNKCKPLAQEVQNLWCVSSVDSEKKANKLQEGRKLLAERLDGEGSPLTEKLRVQVQVNTSGEAEKSGVEPTDAAALCKYIRDKCPQLQLSGLMTIGAIARSKATGEGEENEDFIELVKTRDIVCEELGIERSELELGMGMSNDFEGAIKAGSNEVRIGSTIFGERGPKSEAKILDDNTDGAK